MKLVAVVILALVAVSYAYDEPEKILRSEFNQQPEGGYNFAFETEKGINRNEQGEIKEALDDENKPHKVVVVRGSYGYIDDAGKAQVITYSADEHGFVAEGEAIPKLP